jgi:hypothetical protein
MNVKCQSLNVKSNQIKSSSLESSILKFDIPLTFGFEEI